MSTLTFNPYSSTGGNTISVSIATITAIIAYRFVIERISPAVGYFVLSDYVFILLLIACCAIFIFNLFTAKITRFYKNMATLILYMIVTITFIFLLKPLF
jgi:hypothetical protein